MAVNPPAPKSSAPLVKNVAAAAFVFFDGAPVFGHNNGIIQVALTATATSLRDGNRVGVDLVAVAHLRCSVAAATALHEALGKALAMANPVNEATDEPKH